MRTEEDVQRDRSNILNAMPIGEEITTRQVALTVGRAQDDVERDLLRLEINHKVSSTKREVFYWIRRR